MYRIGGAVKPATDSFYKLVEMRAKRALGLQKEIPLVLPEVAPEKTEQVVSDAQLEGAPPDHFWALRNVSFEVAEGERLGIIGKNGSGKSTLLKLLSRITLPSSGQIRYRGRLISLLEVGTGFHPDLSGRENIYLNAQINGMTDREIKRKFDEIVDFSGLGRQIETPIKRYSSGMYMRLAFSVAAHLESEILVIDEVLAVGDAEFRTKCVDKMLQIAGGGRRTLIFVSHDMEAVRKICDKAILMEHGQIAGATQGNLDVPDAFLEKESLPVARNASEVTMEYIRAGKVFQADVQWAPELAPKMEDIARMRACSIQDQAGQKRTRFEVNEEITVAIEFEVLKPGWHLNAHIYVETLDGQRIFLSMDNLDLKDPIREPGVYRETCRIPTPLMVEGSYRIEVFVCTGKKAEKYITLPDCLSFEIYDARQPVGLRGDWEREWFFSHTRPRCHWSIEKKQ